ncbi:MAG: hypothetical protein ACLTLQ_06280 [[Clostridium] scindens]
MSSGNVLICADENVRQMEELIIIPRGDNRIGIRRAAELERSDLARGEPSGDEQFALQPRGCAGKVCALGPPKERLLRNTRVLSRLCREHDESFREVLSELGPFPDV